MMSKCRYILLLVVLTAFGKADAQSGGVDAARAALVVDLSNKQKNALSTIDRAQAAMSLGHIWLQEEVEVTKDFQRQFNEYLDTFHDALSAVAEVYGIYHECQKTAELVGLLKDVVGDHPWNPVAVAFHSKRNDIYSSIVVKGINMLNDIKMVCFENSKMTEYERNHILSSLRPQLRVINKELLHLYIYLKHTTMLDVWHEIEGRAVDYTPPKNKKEVAERCIKRWKQNAGMKRD